MDKKYWYNTPTEKWHTKICEFCGKEFQCYDKRRKFCSHRCSGKNSGRKRMLPIVVKKCPVCGKKFRTSKKEKRHGHNAEKRCCSISCGTVFGARTRALRKAKRNGCEPKLPIRSFGRAVLEHTAVAEKKLERKLKRYETVHHINHNPKDNSPENLWVYSSQRAHLRNGHWNFQALIASCVGKKIKIDFVDGKYIVKEF